MPSHSSNRRHCPLTKSETRWLVRPHVTKGYAWIWEVCRGGVLEKRSRCRTDPINLGEARETIQRVCTDPRRETRFGKRRVEVSHPLWSTQRKESHRSRASTASESEWEGCRDGLGYEKSHDTQIRPRTCTEQPLVGETHLLIRVGWFDDERSEKSVSILYVVATRGEEGVDRRVDSTSV